MLRAWLERCVSSEWWKPVLVGVGMAGFNIGLLTLLVGILGSPLVAICLRMAVATQIRFGFARWFTKDTPGVSFWQQWRQHHYTKALTACISLGGFWALTAASLPYFVAYLLCCVVTGTINHLCKKYHLWQRIQARWQRDSVACAQ